MPWPLLAVDESVPQVLRKESALVVVPLAEEMTLRVAEKSPVVSTRGAAVPTSLLSSSEVFSSAVLAGGGC